MCTLLNLCFTHTFTCMHVHTCVCVHPPTHTHTNTLHCMVAQIIHAPRICTALLACLGCLHTHTHCIAWMHRPCIIDIYGITLPAQVITHTHTFRWSHAHTHQHMHARTHAHTQTQTHYNSCTMDMYGTLLITWVISFSYKHIQCCVWMHKCVMHHGTHTHTFSLSHTHICVRTHTHTHTYARPRACTHTHTHTELNQSRKQSVRSLKTWKLIKLLYSPCRNKCHCN